jgi:hypothetical protein
LKNQNDLIVMIVAAVICLGVGLGFFFTKRQVQALQPPAPVVTSPAKPQEGAVNFANSLPGGSNNSGSEGGAGGPANFGAKGN